MGRLATVGSAFLFVAVAGCAEGQADFTSSVQGSNDLNNVAVSPVLYEDFTCSIHPDGKAVLFHNEWDIAVNDPMLGMVEVVSAPIFNQKLIDPEGMTDIARENAVGHCAFFIEDPKTGARRNYVSDAFPSSVIGDFRL